MEPTTIVAPRPSFAARFDEDCRGRVASAHERFLAGAEGVGDVSPEILNSWVRSRDLGVDPTGRDLPTHGHADQRVRKLVDAATPVMEALGDQCRDSDAWAMLLDRECVQVAPIMGDERIVRESTQRGAGIGATFHEARVGTNGAGLSAERLESFLVVGEEHFRFSEQNLATVGVPLRDPLGRMAGVLVMCQRIRSANHMIVPYTQSIARAIDEQLALATDGDEQLLFEAFSRHSRRPSLAVVGMNDEVFVANSAAQQLLRVDAATDVLREAVLDVAGRGRSRLIRLALGDDMFRVHCRVVELSQGRHGAVASLTRVDKPRAIAVGKTIDPVARAVELGISVLVTGEAGSGRAHRVRTAADVSEIDGASAAAAPDEWRTRFDALADAGPTLIRNIDVLDESLRARVVEKARTATRWFSATARSVDPELDGAFPVTVSVAPLRERTGELPALVASILSDLGGQGVRCAPEALSVLTRHTWSGNVAQLRRVLASALVKLDGGGVITVSHLPREMAESGRSNSREGLLARTERELVFEALRDANWNRDDAAHALGISRATMYRRIRQFGFRVPSSR
ncbi:Fis family transcriptional regulator [Microbacterium faecale]|uniref:Fis family transcriptional regulator n=1 Tax=Microbacterium faecale TaxID=1804630 RepID=A0A916Y0N3_9MICO|nr:helix-turn-helix domain-containing protein [Microbacterium faecale]GGD25566.1 Fis family transcriptional regulator [Microbacterium faecale]